MSRITLAFVAAVMSCVIAGCSGRSTEAEPTLVLNITSDQKDLHAVVMALHLAEHWLEDGRTAVLFFSVRAPAIAARNLGDDVKFGEDPPVRQQIETLIEKGARAYACPYCVKAVGMKAEDLLPGVEMATRESLFAHLHANTVVFTY